MRHGHLTSANGLYHLSTLNTLWVVTLTGSILLNQISSEGIVLFLNDLSRSQSLISGWLPLVGTVFIVVLECNWGGAILPWTLIEVPQSELSAPTNDINVTAALALVTSHATFYAGFAEYGLRYPIKYIKPVAFLAPLNLLEEFSKPLSLSFRLLGNILAAELTLSVLYTLVPLCIPIPVFLLGLFTSGIQAVVFATLCGAYLGETVESLMH